MKDCRTPLYPSSGIVSCTSKDFGCFTELLVAQEDTNSDIQYRNRRHTYKNKIRNPFDGGDVPDHFRCDDHQDHNSEKHPMCPTQLCQVLFSGVHGLILSSKRRKNERLASGSGASG